jgi:GMP synthase (glutamine-hydrolysing)
VAGRLLYLQNSTSRETVTRLDDRFESWGLTVDRRWAYNGEFPDELGNYDGIFISGSPHGAYEDIPFIHREHELIQEAAEKAIPMLGVCFGHQILASALCGRDQVFRRDHCEVGYKRLDVTTAALDDEIASDIHPKFDMFVWHNDEVRGDHPDMTIIATTNDCPNHIFRYRDLPIWGIQGHPEVTVEASRVWFEENRADLEADGADVDDLHRTAVEAETAKTMLRRFADFIGAGKEA